jgi:hypothetical protein
MHLERFVSHTKTFEMGCSTLLCQFDNFNMTTSLCVVFSKV